MSLRVKIGRIVILFVSLAAGTPVTSSCTAKSPGTYSVSKRIDRKSALSETTIEVIKNSNLPQDDKDAALKSVTSAPAAATDTEQTKTLLDLLTTTLVERGVSPELVSQVAFNAASRLAILNEDNASITAGGDNQTLLAQLDTPEFATVIKILRNAKLPQAIVLEALVSSLDPALKNSTEKLDSLLQSRVLAEFDKAAKATAMQNILATSLGSNEAPVLSETPQILAAPNEQGIVSVNLPKATDREANQLGQSPRYVLVDAPRNGSLSNFPDDASSGGQVVYTPAPGYTGNDVWSYTVCDGSTPQRCTETVTVQVRNQTPSPPNNAPSDVSLTSNAIFENAGANAAVGTLSTTDPDAGNTFTYSLVSGSGDTDNTLFNIDTNVLPLTAPADFETKNTYSVRVLATDQGGLFFEKSIAISVTNVNEAPTDIALSGNTLAENNAENASIGTLSSTDPDTGNTFSYSLLASGCGGTYNDSLAFNVSGSILRATASLDHENQSVYSICIRSTDSGTPSLSYDKVFTINVTDVPEWSQEAYIKAADPSVGDNFGDQLSLYGDTLVVGVKGEDSNVTTITNGTTASANNSLTNPGAVYVYIRSGVSWQQQAFIKAANANSFDSFGYSTSVSGDTLAVGAVGESSNQTTISNNDSASADNSAFYAGAVYVFRRSGSAWSQEAYIKASNGAASDNLGTSISLYGDTLAVGATGEDSNQTTITNDSTSSADNSASSSGAVYVYQRVSATWVQVAYIKASNANTSDFFGTAVSLSGDTLGVGASGEASNQTTITNGSSSSADNSAANAGAVYVYRRNGSTWAQEAYIKAANAEGGDSFGSIISLSGDTLAIGASEDSAQTTISSGSSVSADNSATSSGAVYVYRRNGLNWTMEAYVKAANAEEFDGFGSAVTLSGNNMAVGASSESSNQTTITQGGSASGDNSAPAAGAVYVYRRTGQTWTQDAFVKAANAKTNEYFGSAARLSGDTLAVGAYWEDSNQNTVTNGTGVSSDTSLLSSGAVFVYRNTGRLFDPDVRVTATTSTSITFAWPTNLGPGTTQVIVALAAAGSATPPVCEAAGGGGSLTLSAGVSTYTYSGLTADTKYGFRFCTTDGSRITAGSTVWMDTSPTP